MPTSCHTTSLYNIYCTPLTSTLDTILLYTTFLYHSICPCVLAPLVLYITSNFT